MSTYYYIKCNECLQYAGQYSFAGFWRTFPGERWGKFVAEHVDRHGAAPLGVLCEHDPEFDTYENVDREQYRPTTSGDEK